MATLYISEYGALPTTTGGQPQIVPNVPKANQTITITSTSTQSNAFTSTTKIIRVNADANCWILGGANPTATVTKTRLCANATEYFSVVSGQKIAVIST